jgi:hypothetical protein
VVRTRLQRSLSRGGTLTTGTASAFGRSLALRYGSDLLTLRLLSLLQRGDVVLHAAPFEEFTGLCLGPFTPRPRDSVAYLPRAASEASAPGSDAPCRERLAGRGADTPATITFARRHPYHGDGAGLWPAVGPALRV